MHYTRMAIIISLAFIYSNETFSASKTPFNAGDTIHVTTEKGTKFWFKVSKCKSSSRLCSTGKSSKSRSLKKSGRCVQYKVGSFVHRYCPRGQMNWRNWRWVKK